MICLVANNVSDMSFEVTAASCFLFGFPGKRINISLDLNSQEIRNRITDKEIN